MSQPATQSFAIDARRKLAWRVAAMACATTLALAGCKPAEKQESTPPSQAETRQPDAQAAPGILIGTPVQAGSAETIEVGLGSCADAACPIEIRLKQGSQVRHTAQAGWPASSSTPQPVSLDTSMGVGDPLATADESARIWSTGEEESTVVTAARIVHLRDGRNAVLLDQMAGFEHPKRRHELFAVADGKVVALWSSVEQQGPYWSAVAIEPGDAGSDALVLFETFTPDPSEPDTLTAQRLELTQDNGVVRVNSSPAAVSVAIVGAFADTAAARTARYENPECLAAFHVLDGERIGSQYQGKFVLAAVSSQRTLAERVLQQASACAPQAQVQKIESTTMASGK